MVNFSPSGTGGSAATNVAAAQERMDENREALYAYESDEIENINGTGDGRP